jgi:hypothetical protein
MTAGANDLLKDLRIRDVRTLAYGGNGVAGGRAGPTEPINFKGANVIQALRLILTGTLTVAGGSTDGALAAEQPWSLLREIRIRASSSIRPSANGLLRQFDPASLFNFSTMLDRIALPRTVLAIPGVQTATAFSADLIIPFIMPHSREPRVSLFNPREVDSAVLEADCGDVTDLVVGGDRTSTINAAQLEVQSIEFADAFSVQNTYSLLLESRTEKIYNSTAITGDRQDIRGLHLPARFCLKTYTQAGNVHTPVNTILTGVRLEIDKQETKRLSWAQLTNENQVNYGIAPPAGYRILDLMPDGSFDTLLPMRLHDRNRILELIFDTASVANGRVRIYAQDLVTITQ